MMTQSFLIYDDMLKFEIEMNWANVLGLRKPYNLPLNDQNISIMSFNDRKYFVECAIKKETFSNLIRECSANKRVIIKFIKV